jgi:hypothetical protein
VVAVGDGVFQGIENLNLFENAIRVGGGGDGGGIRPSVTRANEAQLSQSAIEHGPRAHADVFPHLGLDENDDRLRID